MKKLSLIMSLLGLFAVSSLVVAEPIEVTLEVEKGPGFNRQKVHSLAVHKPREISTVIWGGLTGLTNLGPRNKLMLDTDATEKIWFSYERQGSSAQMPCGPEGGIVLKQGVELLDSIKFYVTDTCTMVEARYRPRTVSE